jgi:glucosamine-6-phosphate deaminase
MGIGTVRRAKELYLAWGISKAEILKDTIEGENSSKVPANICRSTITQLLF